VLLLILAIVSIIGTVIPQGQLSPEYIASIGGEQGNRYKLYSMLGFFNMYYSWWFVGLLALLSVNLTACTIKRLPGVLSMAFKPDGLLSESTERSATFRESIALADGATSAELVARLKAAWGAFSEREHEGARHLFVQRRPWNRLAAYVVHASIILIFAGAIIGNLFGFKGVVNIPEGGSASTYLDKKGGEKPLGFTIACDQFTVTYYDAPGGGQSQMPKEFKSILTLTENGKEVPGYKHARVIVNEPLTYRGITFYQSSYGKTGTYSFRVSDLKGGEGVSLTLDSNSSATLADGSTMHVIESVQEVSPYMQGLHGPAARLELHPANGSQPQTLVAFANHPELNRQQAKENNSMVIDYLDGEERPYTGLQVNKDPGVWVVWIGCILMCLALYVAFFMPHQRLWVRIDEDEIVVAGHTTRSQEAFRSNMEELLGTIRTQPGKEEHTS